jgi:glucose/arabinose dehydrogenase
MRLSIRHPLALRAFALLVCASSASAAYPPGYGPKVTLPKPDPALLPTVDIAPAKGWSANQAPTAASGLVARAFANGLEHPRTIFVLPNGDVLVAETNAPERPDHGKGIKGKAMALFMKKAGAAVPSANRITLFRDADGDGTPETRTAFLQNLNSPFGMALVGDQLYIANSDAVVRVPYRTGR